MASGIISSFFLRGIKKNCKCAVEVDDEDSYGYLNVFPQHTADPHTLHICTRVSRRTRQDRLDSSACTTMQGHIVHKAGRQTTQFFFKGKERVNQAIMHLFVIKEGWREPAPPGMSRLRRSNSVVGSQGGVSRVDMATLS
jgi:hypothetical protein